MSVHTTIRYLCLISNTARDHEVYDKSAADYTIAITSCLNCTLLPMTRDIILGFVNAICLTHYVPIESDSGYDTDQLTPVDPMVYAVLAVFYSLDSKPTKVRRALILANK